MDPKGSFGGDLERGLQFSTDAREVCPKLRRKNEKKWDAVGKEPSRLPCER